MKLETISQLRDAAEARLELEKRYDDNKILFYQPCCRVHQNKCPVLPCLESKHCKFHVSDKRIRIILGGNRSSKTTTGIIELLFRACFKVHPFTKKPNPPKGKYRFYSSDFGVIEKFILPVIKDWIPRSCLAEDGANKQEAWDNSYDNRTHLLKLKNSVIDFMSYDQDPSKSESVELDGIVADEEMPENIYSASLARLVSRQGCFWMMVTPLYNLTWGMRFLNTTDAQVDVFRFEIYDNPYLSEKAIKEFEASIPEHEKDARIYGQFMELQGLVFKELRTDIHLIASDDNKKHNYPVVFCLDPHPRKPSAMTWAYVTPKDDVVFFDELEIAGTARDIARAIRAKEAEHGGRTMFRIIDPAARAQASSLGYETDTLREFEKEGMGFTLADNSEAGYNVVHEFLTYDYKQPMSSLNRPKCFFTRDVQKTWYSMTNLLWDEWTFKRNMRDKKETIRDYKKDHADTVRYILAARPTFRSMQYVDSMPIGNMVNQKSFVPHSDRLRNMVVQKKEEVVAA